MSKNPVKNGKKTGYRSPPEHTRFKPGNPGPGRPKGCRNKVGEAFLQDLYATWQRKGAAAIERLADEDPATFVRVTASILPKEMNINHNALADLTDDELAAFDALLAEAQQRLEQEAGSRDGMSTTH